MFKTFIIDVRQEKIQACSDLSINESLCSYKTNIEAAFVSVQPSVQ